MPSVKPYLFVLAAVVLVFILAGLARAIGFAKQIDAWTTGHQLIMKCAVLILFLVFVAAAVPVFIKCFMLLQNRIGNGELKLMKLLRLHGMRIVYITWIVFGLGFAIALPAIIKHNLAHANSK